MDKFEYTVSNTGTDAAEGIHVVAPLGYQFNGSNVTVTANDNSVWTFTVTDNTRVDIAFTAGSELSGTTGTATITFSDITVPAAPQTGIWRSTVDSVNVTGLNTVAAFPGARQVIVVGPPEFRGKVLSKTNAFLNAVVGLEYEVRNPAGSNDILTGVRLPAPAGWTIQSVTSDSGTAALIANKVIVNGLALTSTASADAVLRLNLTALAPGDGSGFYWNSQVTSWAYSLTVPANNFYDIANADSSDVLLSLNPPDAGVKLNKNAIQPLAGQRVDITLSVNNAGRVLVALYSVSGQLVRKLVDEDRTPGVYTESWDGKVDGQAVASGVYLVFTQIGGYTETKKIIVIK
jgi:hypothetical protein